MKARAAIVWRAGKPFSIEEVELDAPRDTEVQVRIRAVGICHTDLIGRDGLYPTPLPLVCGHEGAGVVEMVGAKVTKVVPGDKVVLSFVSCGGCENCLRGESPYCDHMFLMNFGGRRPDGSSPISRNGETINGVFMGQSSFASRAIADERTVVKITADVDFPTLAPLGCSVLTGVGAVVNTLRPQVGSSIAVFGCGAVGLCAIMAAKMAGCLPVIAIDPKLNRLGMALRLGATHAVDPTQQEPVEAVRDISGGGVDYSLEVTGLPSVFPQAVEALRETGMCGLVGAAPYGEHGSIHLTTLLRGRRVQGVICGDATPDIFIPRLTELNQAGLLPYQELITQYQFEEINKAAAASEAGTVIKPVLLMPND